MAEETEDRSQHRSRTIQFLNSFSNMFTFGTGLVFLISGIAYVSTLGYSYSMNSLSVSLIAGFQLAAGILLVAVPIVRVCYARQQRVQRNLIMTLAVLLVLFGILFFVLGVIGLVSASSEATKIAASDDMFKTMSKYDQYNQKGNSNTQKMNW